MFNRRVKGTEKFWSEEGAEAILQLRADHLSETEPLKTFWENRKQRRRGDGVIDARAEQPDYIPGRAPQGRQDRRR